MNKKRIIFFGLFLIMLFIAGCVGQTKQNTTGTNQTEPTTKPDNVLPETKGRIVFAVTDAAADLNSVSSVKVTVDGIRVHSSSQGWVTIPFSPRTYDLLELKSENKLALLADVKLNEDVYDEIRLDISKVMITDANEEKEAKLPSNELKIKGDLEVKANSTATTTFDFIVDESLHITGNGKYVLAPVIKLETRENAEVEVKNNEDVEIKSGNIKTNVKVGMDINGNVGVNINIPSTAVIVINEAGNIVVNQGTNVSIGQGTTGKIIVAVTDKAADIGAVTSILVTVDSVKVHSAAEGWITVSSSPQTFDLLELKEEGKQMLIAQADLPKGSYQQIELEIGEVIVTDNSGEHTATLPSEKLRIVGSLVVEDNGTSTVLFDFIADESLHVTGNQEYIMAPVVKVETRSKTNTVIDENTVTIEGGTVSLNVKFGMNEKGEVGINRGISKDSEIVLEGGAIKIKSKITVEIN